MILDSFRAGRSSRTSRFVQGQNVFVFSPCSCSDSASAARRLNSRWSMPIVLRGLSFPHPEQLVTIGLIDPKATDQNNNFGFGSDSDSTGLRRLKSGPDVVLLDGRLSHRIDNKRYLQEQSATL